jgi:hypothetical protein
MSVRLNHEAFGTYETTNERKGTSYSTHVDAVEDFKVEENRGSVKPVLLDLRIRG